MSILGLALAFGAFYVFSWPTTLSGSAGNSLHFGDVETDELLHAGLMNFAVSGRREIEIVTVKLNAPTAGIELVATRIGLGEAGTSIGSERGEQASIDALPRAPGYVLYPKDRGSFVVTFRAERSASFDGLIVTYQTGWLTRSVRVGPKVTVTVPISSTVPTVSPSPSPTAS